MKNAIILVCLLFSSFAGYSQVGIGTKNPDTTSVLDLSSTTKGLLIPRMTTVQRNAIISPAMGLQILNVDDMCLDIYDGRQWIKNCGMKESDALEVASRSSISDSIWTKDGDRIFPADPARIGIGTEMPDSSALLDIASTSQGFLMPRMTTAQRDLIAAPAVGLQILNLDDMCVDIYEGAGWIKNCGYQITGHDTISASWTPKATFLGISRTGAVGFSIGSIGYLGTGFSGEVRNDFWAYDPASNAWSQKANVGTEGRKSAIALTIPTTNGIRGFIGTGRGEGNTALKDFWEFIPDSNKWEPRSSLPGSGFYGGAAFCIDSMGYVGTGLLDIGGEQDAFYKYDYNTNSWSTIDAFPQRRAYTTAFVHNGIAYVGLGDQLNMNPLGHVIASNFYTYNPVTDQWGTQPISFPVARKGVSTFTINGSPYLIAGKDDNGYYNTAYRFTGQPPYFEQIPDFPGAGRWQAVAFAIGNKGYLGTGEFAEVSYALDFYEYDEYPLGNIYSIAPPSEPLHSFSDGLWTKERDNIYNATSGNVGLGTNTPHAPLQFAQTVANRKIVLYETDDNDHKFYGFGVNGGILRYQVPWTANHVFYAGFSASFSDELMRITTEGHVGIRNASPHAPLQFSNNTSNRKIVLTEVQNNDHLFYGFGTGTNLLKYQIGSNSGSAAHAFFAGVNAASSTELMRITGNGNVGIGISTVNNKLDINGNNRTGNNHPTSRPFYVTGSLSESSNGIEFRNDDGTQGLGFGYNTMYASGSQTNQDLGLKARGSTGNLKFNTDNTERMRILGNGNVGIGTSTPVTRLQIANGSDAFWTDNSGFLVLGETSATNIVIDNNEIIARNNAGASTLFLQAEGSGGVRIGGTTPTNYQLELSSNNAAKPGTPVWIVPSDARLKKDIEPFTDGLDLVRKINPIWFRYNGLNGITETGRFAGIIAQEIQKIAPYMIGTTKSADRDGESYLSYDANAMTYILINAVKEQQTLIDSLQQENAALQNKYDTSISDMEQKMMQMEAMINKLTAERKP